MTWTRSLSIAGLLAVQLVATQLVAQEQSFRVNLPAEQFATITFAHEVVYDPGQSTTFAQPGFLATPDSGEIYVADFADQQIVVLDSDFSETKRFGAPGQGPGELQDAWQIINPGNGVFVWDRFAGRMHWFSDQGQFVRSMILPAELAGADPRSLVATGPTTFVVAAVAPGSSVFGKAAHLLRLVQENQRAQRYRLELVKSFADTPVTDPMVYRFVGGGVVTLDRDGGILYAQATPYAIAKYNQDGNVLWRFDDESAFAHWSTYFGVSPAGSILPRSHPYVRAVWPLEDNVYLVQIQAPTEEFQRFDRTRVEGESVWSGERIWDSQFEIVRVEQGQVTERARFDGPQGLEFFHQDQQGRLYTYDSTTERLLRTTVRISIGRSQ